MKKIKSVIFAAAMFTSFTACSSKANSEIQPTTDENGKTVITIGVPMYYNDLIESITNYNNSQDRYFLKVVDYTDITGNKRNDADYEYDEEIKQMKLDLIEDSAPDIIYADNSFMCDMMRSQMFEDMYELMDEYSGIQRTEVLTNMLEGFEVDGKLPLIGTDYRINTAIAKTKFVGDDAENWNVDRFIETAGSLPDDMQILKNSSFYSWDGASRDNRQSILDYTARKLLNDCVDIKNNTCSFDNSSLKKAIDFALGYPDSSRVNDNVGDMNDEDQRNYFMDMQWAILNDKALISGLYITGLGPAEGTDVWSEFGEDDMTFVGYPSDNGNGAITEFSRLYGITKNCDNKEGAWDCMSYILRNSPISKEVLDKQYNTRVPEDDMNIYSKYIIWVSGKGEMPKKGKKITQERIDQVYNYIQSVKVEPYCNSDVESVIKEELSYVLGGERTPDQFIGILNDRISTYLAENE